MTQINWESFDRFDGIISKWMPAQGQGETMASQMVTAINKLVYKWYNDGDVFDNTHYLEGWWNDLSSYANWLNKHIDGADKILKRISGCRHGKDYEGLLYSLAEEYLNQEMTEKYNVPAVGSIYECKGPFKYEDPEDDEEDEEEWW